VVATNARDAERIARDAERKAQDEKVRQATSINRELSGSLSEESRLRATIRTKAPTDPVWPQLRETPKAAEGMAASELADPVLVGRVKAILTERKQIEADQRMAARLEDIRLKSGTFQAGQVVRVSGGSQAPYAAAFKDYGIPILELSVEEAA